MTRGVDDKINFGNTIYDFSFFLRKIMMILEF